MFVFSTKIFRIFQLHKFFLDLLKLTWNCTICVEMHAKINSAEVKKMSDLRDAKMRVALSSAVTCDVKK